MIHLQPTSPGRPPNWRWQKATVLREQSRAPSRSRDDEWVRLARRFQVEHAECRNDWDYLALSEVYPAVVEAREVWTNETLQGCRRELEARLLAREETTANVCRRLCMTPGGVAAYEALFFNVRDRLENTGWIVHSILGRSIHSGLSEREYDTLWKLYGYFYGPVLLDCLVDTVVPTTRPTSVDKVPGAYAEDGRTALRRKALIAIRTMPVNSFTQPMLLEIEHKYQEMEKAASGAGGANALILVDTLGDMMGAMRSRWTVGDGTAERPVFKQLEAADTMAAEPRAGEMLRIAAGMDPGIDEMARDLRFPEVTRGTDG